MNTRTSTRAKHTPLAFAAAAGVIAAAVLWLPGSAGAQTRQPPRTSDTRQSNPLPRRDDPGQKGEVHARRETVRTINPIPPPSKPDTAPQRPGSPAPFPSRQPQLPTSPPARPATPPERPAAPPERPAAPPPHTSNPPQFPRRTPSNPPSVGHQTGRTPIYAGSARPSMTPLVPNAREAPAHRLFTKTAEGRRYDNGVLLRKGSPVREDWQRRYFPRGSFHFPKYRQSYSPASTAISPFGFYYGVCAPFIALDHTHRYPPAAVYVDIPLYSGNECEGYPPIGADENYVDRDSLLGAEPGLTNAVDEIREAFGAGDIDALVTLVDPRIAIAVFLKGQYVYTLDATDYIDLTRDAFRSTETIAFGITRIHQRADGVYAISGDHTYRAHDGSTRKVYVSYVLEDIRGVWTLTQVGTAPDRTQSW